MRELALVALFGAFASPVLAQESIGRFQYYPASGEMPAILLDTTTGCVERFMKLTSVNNPKDVEWARQYMDATMPKMSKMADEPKALPNSSPPQRCKTNSGESK